MNGCIAIANQKGGVGKSTTAVGLGELVARLDGLDTVVLIDLDGSLFNQGHDRALGDASTWAQVAREAGEPLAVEVVAPPREVTPVRLPGWIRNTYHDRLVILDCPPLTGGGPAHEAATEVVAERGGAVLVPAMPGPMVSTSTVATMETAAGSGVTVLVALVDVDERTIATRQLRAELAEAIEGDPADGLDPIPATVLSAVVPHREELRREGLGSVSARSAMLALYRPMLAEIRERLG